MAREMLNKKVGMDVTNYIGKFLGRSRGEIYENHILVLDELEYYINYYTYRSIEEGIEYRSSDLSNNMAKIKRSRLFT